MFGFSKRHEVVKEINRGEIYNVGSGEVIIISNNTVNRHSSFIHVLPINKINLKSIVVTDDVISIHILDLDKKVGEVSVESMENLENGLNNSYIHGKQGDAIIIKRKNHINV